MFSINIYKTQIVLLTFENVIPTKHRNGVVDGVYGIFVFLALNAGHINPYCMRKRKEISGLES